MQCVTVLPMQCMDSGGLAMACGLQFTCCTEGGEIDSN